MIVFSETVDVAGKLTVADIPLLIAHLIASFVMLGFLTFFVYRPFRRWSNARANKIKTDFDKTQSLLVAAQKKDVLAEQKWNQAQRLTKQMLVDTNARSLEEKKTLLREANSLKEQMLNDARLEVVQIRKDAQKEIEQAILVNAVQLSEKLLTASIDKKKHQQLIGDFLDSLDE